MNQEHKHYKYKVPARGYHKTHQEYMRCVDPAMIKPDDFPATHEALPGLLLDDAVPTGVLPTVEAATQPQPSEGG